MKIKPVYISLVVASIIAALVIAFLNTTVVVTSGHESGHTDFFRVGETNNMRTVLIEIQKLDYIERAWIELPNIYFKGKNLSGVIFHLDGTNILFTGYGMTIDEIPETLTEDGIHRDISLLMEKTKI